LLDTDKLLAIFNNNADILPDSSPIASPGKVRDSIRIREDIIAYYCEKCKTSLFKSSEKRCAKCGHLFGYCVR